MTRELNCLADDNTLCGKSVSLKLHVMKTSWWVLTKGKLPHFCQWSVNSLSEWCHSRRVHQERVFFQHTRTILHHTTNYYINNRTVVVWFCCKLICWVNNKHWVTLMQFILSLLCLCMHFSMQESNSSLGLCVSSMIPEIIHFSCFMSILLLGTTILDICRLVYFVKIKNRLELNVYWAKIVWQTQNVAKDIIYIMRKINKRITSLIMQCASLKNTLKTTTSAYEHYPFWPATIHSLPSRKHPNGPGTFSPSLEYLDGIFLHAPRSHRLGYNEKV